MLKLSTTVERPQRTAQIALSAPVVGYVIFIAKSIGGPLNIAWALVLLLWTVSATLLVWWIVQEKVRNILDIIDLHATRIVIGLIVVVAGVFITISILQARFFAISSQAEDTAYYSQVLWNTLQGNFLSGNLQQERLYHPPVLNDLAIHVSPVLFGILPIYALFPHFLTLLILRDIILAVAAWPLFLLARERMGGTAGVAAAILYLVNPAVIAQGCEAFYLLQLAPLPFFYALRAFARENFIQFVYWTGAALTLREDIAIAVAGFGIWALVGRRRWQWAVVGVGIPIAWWGFATLLIQPALGRWGNSAFDVALAGGKSNPFGIYQSLLESPLWILEALRSGGLYYLYQLLRSVAFLGVLGGEGLLAAPSLAANLFLGRAFYSGTDPFSRFALLPSCALIGATVLLVWRLSQKYSWDMRGFSIILFLLLPSVSLLDGVKDAVRGRLEVYTVQNDAPALREALAQIPPTASVAAPNYALSALANRPKLFYVTYLYRYPQARPDYILLDHNLDRIIVNPSVREHYVALLDDLSHSTEYEVAWQRGEYFLLRRIEQKR